MYSGRRTVTHCMGSIWARPDRPADLLVASYLKFGMRQAIEEYERYFPKK